MGQFLESVNISNQIIAAQKAAPQLTPEKRKAKERQIAEKQSLAKTLGIEEYLEEIRRDIWKEGRVDKYETYLGPSYELSCSIQYPVSPYDPVLSIFSPHSVRRGWTPETTSLEIFVIDNSIGEMYPGEMSPKILEKYYPEFFEQ